MEFTQFIIVINFFQIFVINFFQIFVYNCFQIVINFTQTLTQTLTQVASRYGRRVSAMESADLRHDNGYALRLRGVSTLDTQGLKR